MPICNLCNEQITNSCPHLLRCGHLFHEYCLMNFNIYRSADDKQCPSCGAKISKFEYRALQKRYPPTFPERVLAAMNDPVVSKEPPKDEAQCVLCEMPFCLGNTKTFYEPYNLWYCEHSYHLFCIASWMRDGNNKCFHCDTQIAARDMAVVNRKPDDDTLCGGGNVLVGPWSSDDETMVDSWSDDCDDC